MNKTLFYLTLALMIACIIFVIEVGSIVYT